MKLKILFLLLCFSVVCSAQQQFIDKAFFLGRDYYVLRSGRAKMVLQADKSNLGPAFTYTLFDAENTVQTHHKKKAFNYTQEGGFAHSALEVVLANYPLTALGTQLVTSWIVEDNIPSVQADWWASGVKVREVIRAATLNGVFKRTITLDPVALMGIDTAYIRLSLPEESILKDEHSLLWMDDKAGMAISSAPALEYKISTANGKLEIGPIILVPGEKREIVTYLLLDVYGKKPQTLLTEASSIENVIAKEHQQLVDRWRNSNTIDTKDVLVRHTHDVARYILPAYVSDQGQLDASLFEYGAQWVRDASNTALGMIHIGEFELARAMLDFMLKKMINEEGVTMIGNAYDDPDREQFDQMGEFMHVMKCYLDWTGDSSLLTQNKQKLITMIERPLHPSFRDETGMVHNRREFWERTFDDAYELAYQTWVIIGLRSGADVARFLGAEKKAETWRAEADRIQRAMLTHPTKRLIDKGHLIKRRNTNGEIVSLVDHVGSGYPDSPVALEKYHSIMPDATMASPISLRVVDPSSELAKNTLDKLEELWNSRWSFGGYERYNSSSQLDQPGPWTFATTFIMRAQHEAGLLDRSRRSLDWLAKIDGGHTGAWREAIPIIRNEGLPAGLIAWTTSEVSYFMIHHLLGISFERNTMIIKPVLFSESAPLKADLRYRDSRFQLDIDGAGVISHALINERKVLPDKLGRIIVPVSFTSGKIQIITNK